MKYLVKKVNLYDSQNDLDEQSIVPMFGCLGVITF